MRFIFVDEIQQQNKKAEFFGVASLVVDSSHYKTPRDGVDEALEVAGWDRANQLRIFADVSTKPSGRYITK